MVATLASPPSEEMTPPSPPGRAELERVACQFALGRLVSARPLTGGHTVPYHLVTARGEFVAHSGRDERWGELYAAVASRLNAAGVAQPSPLRLPAGRFVTTEGWTAQEFVPGRWVERPDEAQSPRFARYLARYHAALARLQPPSWLLVEDNAWRRGDSLTLALTELRAETHAHESLDAVRDAYERCAVAVEASIGLLGGLDVQLIHGDASSENVLWGGGDPLLVDFTPGVAHPQLSLAISQFWHHVYFNDLAVDLPRIVSEFRAYSDDWPGEPAGEGVYPALLLQAALRQLAQTRARIAEGVVFSDAERLRLATCSDAIVDAQPELHRRLA